MADLKLSPYSVDVIRNDHFEQVTKKKCQSWNGRKIGGRQLVCNLRQFRPYGKTTSFRTHACCKTHVFTFDPRFFVHSKIDLSPK